MDTALSIYRVEFSAEEADERELEDMKAQLVRALQERLNRDESGT